MAQRVTGLDYNVGKGQSENEVMLDIVKLLVFPHERDINRTSAAAKDTKTAKLINDIAKRVQAVRPCAPSMCLHTARPRLSVRV